MKKIKPSTGIRNLDKLLHGLKYGDKVVWQIDTIENYLPFVDLFCADAIARKEKLIYFRFAKHKSLVAKGSGVKIYKLNPADGFEAFITKIHEVVENVGQGGYYVFDSLSELAIDCYSDRMLGNFFILTCPFLFKQKTIAYFAVFRNYHSYHAALPIAETTQILLDIYRYNGRIYVHPIKVHGRYSRTMYMPHLWDKNDFIPIKQSSEISNILQSAT